MATYLLTDDVAYAAWFPTTSAALGWAHRWGAPDDNYRAIPDIGDVADARNFLVGFAEDGPLNWPGYEDAHYRMLIAKADAARSEEARNAWLHAAELRLLNANAVVPLYFYTSKHLVAPRVAGYAPNALDRHASRWLSLRSGAMPD